MFAEAGAKVLMVDLDEGALQAAAANVKGEVSSYVADVTEPAQAKAYVAAALERYGTVDAFLANAGIEGGNDPIVDGNVEDFDRVLAVNVRGVWLASSTSWRRCASAAAASSLPRRSPACLAWPAWRRTTPASTRSSA